MTQQPPPSMHTTAVNPAALADPPAPVMTDLYALEGDEQRFADSPFAEQLDWRRAVTRREYLDELRRLRAGVRVGLVIWPAFVIIDLLVVTWIEQASWTWFLVPRALGMLVLGALALVLRRDPPLSVEVVRPLEVGGVALLAALVTVMSLPVHNYGGSYVSGIILLILARAVLIPAPWKHGLIPAAAIAATYPLGQLVGALVLPEFADRLSDGRSATSLMVAHLHQEPEPPSERLGAGLPVDLERIVLRCLDKEPAGRYPDAAALALELESCSTAMAAAGSPGSVAPAP